MATVEENIVEFVLVTPRGLEMDDDGNPITRLGKLPITLRKENLNVHDLVAVSSNNEPFKLGTITNLSTSKSAHREVEYIMTKPNQDDALVGFVKRMALQHGRTKNMKR